MPFKVPYDSTVLAAVVAECQALVGGKVQKVSQPDDRTVVLQIYRGTMSLLLISCDSQHPRAYLTAVKPANPSEPPHFCQKARAATEGGRITAIRQRGFDRIMEIEVSGEGGRPYLYVAELMGKHSNLMLLDPADEIVAVIKTVSSAQSRRPVRVGLPYQPPPPASGTDPRELSPEQFDALVRDADIVNADWLRAMLQGVGPFLASQLMEQSDLAAAYAAWQGRLVNVQWQPSLIRDEQNIPVGAYPMPVVLPAGCTEAPRDSISQALDQFYLVEVRRAREEAIRSQLRSVALRARKSADRALAEIAKGLQEVEKAGRYQVFGELILAYGHGLPPKIDLLRAPDYTDPDNAQIDIPLDPEHTTVENAERYFRKARKARSAEAVLNRRHGELEQTVRDLDAMLVEMEVEDEAGLIALRERARNKGWLREQALPTTDIEKRPYEGHKIREVRTPDGISILYGETATANDFLTQRVARPNDWWLHVRGGTSAHAIVPTANKPDKTPRSTIEEAARIVARNSPSKHSSVVAVDYTLRKHVRKPRGAPAGTVTYSQEKTIHVSPGL